MDLDSWMACRRSKSKSDAHHKTKNTERGKGRLSLSSSLKGSRRHSPFLPLHRSVGGKSNPSKSSDLIPDDPSATLGTEMIRSALWAHLLLLFLSFRWLLIFFLSMIWLSVS